MIELSASAPGVVERLLEALRRPGAVLLLPTETVYGLICRADDAAAIERISCLKQRKEGKRYGWFLRDWSELKNCGLVSNGVADDLARRYFPGPLTLIIKTCAGATQGVRIPAHPLLAQLLARISAPLAQTSANASGQPDPKRLSEALAQLSGQPDVAVDGGILPGAPCGSTVVDTTTCPAVILRQGALQLGDRELVAP